MKQERNNFWDFVGIGLCIAFILLGIGGCDYLCKKADNIQQETK